MQHTLMQLDQKRNQAVLGALLEYGEHGSPNRLRFLSGDEADAQGFGLADTIRHPTALGAIAAGVELLLDHKDFLLDGAEPTTLLIAAGLSLAQVTGKLNDIQSGIDRIEERLGDIKVQLDRIEEKVDRIDVTLQEQELRRSIQHLLAKHHTGAELGLGEFCKGLVEAVDMFEVVFEGERMRLGEGLGIRFSVETRDVLEDVYRLLRGVRYAAFAQSNRESEGDPACVLVADSIYDYWERDVAAPAAFAARHRSFLHFKKTRDQHRSMNGSPLLKRGRRDAWFHERVMVPARANYEALDPDAVRLEEALRGFVSGDPEAFLGAYRVYWLWRTSAGLLWRVRQEAEWLVADYEPFTSGRALRTSSQPLLLALPAGAPAQT